jgi:E3 ubiquitin-protein ligase HUWE1
MGALSLNQAGQNLLQTRSNVINLVFHVFTSDAHTIALQEKSNANLIGGDVDELVRHHPWLKPSIFAAITATLGRIEEAIKQYIPKAGMEGYFRLLLGKSPEPEAGVSSGDAKMETDQPATASSGTALPNNSEQTPQTSPNGDSSYHITEIPPYQYLNCFSKVGCIPLIGMVSDGLQFLIGFFSHAQHGRELLEDTDILERLDRLLTAPQWPIGFPLGRNLDNVLVVSRRLMDSNPTVVLKHHITKVNSSIADEQVFARGKRTRGPLEPLCLAARSVLEPFIWPFVS